MKKTLQMRRLVQSIERAPTTRRCLSGCRRICTVAPWPPVAPDNRRALTLEAASDCVVHSLTAKEMALLCYQNPKLGLHVMRLAVARLMRDLSRQRSQPASQAA